MQSIWLQQALILKLWSFEIDFIESHIQILHHLKIILNLC